MGAKRLSLADDFGLELELAADYVLVRVDDVPNEVAAENRRRGRRLEKLLKEANALVDPPKKKGASAETEEQADERLVRAEALYDEGRDVMLEIVATQTTVDGAPPDLEELRRRLPTLGHAMWASNGLRDEVNLDPTVPRATS